MMASNGSDKTLLTSRKSNNKIQGKEPESKTVAALRNGPHELTVAGIGSSAGGWKALHSFFDALARDRGMAVVVKHLKRKGPTTALPQTPRSMSTRQVRKKTEGLLYKSVSIMSSLSMQLSLAALPAEGLADALVWLARQMRDQYGRQVTIHTNDIATRVGDGRRVLLFEAKNVFDGSNATGGLVNIRHRLQLMDCDMYVKSQHHSRTHAVIRVPADQVHT